PRACGHRGAEAGELVEEVLVAAVDQFDAVDLARALSGQGGDEVAESAAQVRHVDAGALERGGSGDHGRVQVVATAEAAGRAAEAFAVKLDIRPHRSQGVGEAEAVLVVGLLVDRLSLGLGHRLHQGLLPVGHEARVDVGLEREGPESAAGVAEADAGLLDVELTADLPEDVEEGYE